MKKLLLLFSLAMILGAGLTAQSMEELQQLKQEKKAAIADLQGKIDAIQSEVNGIQNDIDLMSGWKKGFAGIIGFDMATSNSWAANTNPDASSSSLNIGLSAYANKDSEQSFWNNKLTITKSWQDVDLIQPGETEEDDGLFDNGTVDIFNFQSLYGYKLNPKLAVSAMADLNTSIEGFLDPGTLDFGAGITWLPAPNFTVVIHPLNYHLAFSGIEGVDTEGSVGAKFRADYANSFPLAGKTVNYSSTLMSFVPYSDMDPSMFEYTWLNTLSFQLWKGLGVGVGFGFRNADFEDGDNTQSYQTLGVSYAF